MRPYASDTGSRPTPSTGRIVCFCERVTRGEIRDALRLALPPPTSTGCAGGPGCMNGRCQGFFCGAEVESLLRSSPR